MFHDLDSLQKQYCHVERFVRAEEVAKQLNLNVWTVYKMAQRKLIPSYKIGKGRRFRISEVIAAMK